MHSALPFVHSRLRLLLERCIFVLVAMLGLRTWYVEGLIIPFQVTSGSMAGALIGSHRDVVCGDCGHRFVYGTDLPPASPRAVCPICGYSNQGLDRQPASAGDRLLIHKSIFRFRRPRRWEVVAFRHPRQADQTHVKRVVGLPDESVRIQGGDVYVRGEVQRKKLGQQRALAVLVHDANRQPILDPVPPLRWQGEGEDTLWSPFGGRFARRSTSDEGPAVDWLVYHHWRRARGKEGEVSEGPITDHCGYNQTRPRRREDTHVVTDLLLSLRLTETFGQGRLVIRATDGRDEFQVRINPDGSGYEVLQNGRPIPGAAKRAPLSFDEVTLEVSLFDQQFLLAFDGRVALEWPYDRSPRPLEPTSRPLAIGSQGGLGVSIRDLRVYRDVYYTHPIGPRGRWGLAEPVELAADEYFVLGDNSPISEDSRTWPGGPAVPAKLLVGKPLLVHFPAKSIQLGRWVFQVPDPAKIRYIR